MSDYRLYFFDRNHRINKAIEIESDSDDAAVQCAKQQARDQRVWELWQRARRVMAWGLDPLV